MAFFFDSDFYFRLPNIYIWDIETLVNANDVILWAEIKGEKSEGIGLMKTQDEERVLSVLSRSLCRK